jgi:hypothetical protein
VSSKIGAYKTKIMMPKELADVQMEADLKVNSAGWSGCGKQDIQRTPKTWAPFENRTR